MMAVAPLPISNMISTTVLVLKAVNSVEFTVFSCSYGDWYVVTLSCIHLSVKLLKRAQIASLSVSIKAVMN